MSLRACCWSALEVLLALVFSTPVCGQAVHVVAGDGTGDFLQIQPAVDAAAAGDVIVVRSHTQRYEPAEIIAKSLTVIGDGATRPEVSRIRIANIPVSSTVTLRFLDLEGFFEVGPFLEILNYEGLSLENNAGCVWLEDLEVHGSPGISSAGSDAEFGETGLVAGGNACVVLIGGVVRGGDGGVSVGGTSKTGGEGARFKDSRVASYGSTFLGGSGALAVVAQPFGAQGGVGIEATSSTLFLSGSSVTGGSTGVGSMSPIATASGLSLINGSSVQYLATSFDPGAGNAVPGAPISSGGVPSTVENLNEVHRELTVPAPVREQAVAQLSYSGQPGDTVLLALSLDPEWLSIPSVKGTLHLGPVASSFVIGSADANGDLVLPFSGPSLPPGVSSLTGFAQPLVADTNGSLRLGAPSSILLLDSSL